MYLSTIPFRFRGLRLAGDDDAEHCFEWTGRLVFQAKAVPAKGRLGNGHIKTILAAFLLNTDFTKRLLPNPTAEDYAHHVFHRLFPLYEDEKVELARVWVGESADEGCWYEPDAETMQKHGFIRKHARRAGRTQRLFRKT